MKCKDCGIELFIPFWIKYTKDQEPPDDLPIGCLVCGWYIEYKDLKKPCHFW